MSGSPEISARERLLRLQLATYDRLKEEIASEFRRESRSMRLFRRRYEREVRSYRKVISKADLVERISEAHIVLCGDFHTLRPAQRTVIRLARPLAEAGRKIILAMEMIPSERETLANDYVRNRTTEEAFLDGLEYRKKWGFPWRNYRPIFEFAKLHKVRIVGLNAEHADEMSLEERDEFAAAIIGKTAAMHTDHLIFCQYGDLHLATSHLPHRLAAVLRKEKIEPKVVTIFQNSETIYWKLAEKGLETSVDVVEIGKDRFCVLSAAPWMKWQSYRTWLEDQSILLTNEEESPDYYHQILELSQRISEFLGVKPKGLEHFSIVTASDPTMISEWDEYSQSFKETSIATDKIIEAEMVEGGSYLFPRRAVLYLSDLSENRAAEKASQLVAAKLDPKGWELSQFDEPRDLFYAMVLWEAIGFFGSKVINHKRKCDQYRDLEGLLLRTFEERRIRRIRRQREVAKLLLTHRDYERRRIRLRVKTGAPRKLYRLPPTQIVRAKMILGRILADSLYTGMATDRIALSEVLRLFAPLIPSETPTDRYWEMVTLISPRTQKASKEDQF